MVHRLGENVPIRLARNGCLGSGILSKSPSHFHEKRKTTVVFNEFAVIEASGDGEILSGGYFLRSTLLVHGLKRFVRFTTPSENNCGR
jgi:hypothetical protein